MEQKELFTIFDEEFKKGVSFKVFNICLAVMVASCLAMGATVFYLQNGAAAKVLSGKEQLMANVWGRVFLTIAVSSIVVILSMFMLAALFGGLSVLAERNKRKQAAILEVPQIQEQSKDNEVASPGQPVQPEPTVQGPEAEAADIEEATEREDSEEESKRPYVRRGDHGKASGVTINDEKFHSIFKEVFIMRNASTGSCSYDILSRALKGRSWTKSDLARVALLIYESDVLKGDRKDFNAWLVDFFEIVGRDDIPQTKTIKEYNDLSKSSINFRQTFNDLVYTYYHKTGKTTLIFDIII